QPPSRLLLLSAQSVLGLHRHALLHGGHAGAGIGYAVDDHFAVVAPADAAENAASGVVLGRVPQGAHPGGDERRRDGLSGDGRDLLSLIEDVGVRLPAHLQDGMLLDSHKDPPILETWYWTIWLGVPARPAGELHAERKRKAV